VPRISWQQLACIELTMIAFEMAHSA